jgi:hypothetical protein
MAIEKAVPWDGLFCGVWACFARGARTLYRAKMMAFRPADGCGVHCAGDAHFPLPIIENPIKTV